MRKRLSLICACALAASAAVAENSFNSPAAPLVTNLTATGAVRAVQFDLYPSAQSYAILSAPNPAGLWSVNTNFFWSTVTNVSGGTTNLLHDFRSTNATAEADFYRLQVTPLSSNALLAAQVLNRIAYGPTPDELERVTAIGADAYIAEQLAMDGLPETLDTFVSVTTNSVANDPLTNWVQVVATGKMNQTNLFVFLTQPGTILLDDVRLVEGTDLGGANLIANGDFESALTPPWTVPASHTGSVITNGAGRNGGSALRLQAVAAGTNTTSGAVWQPFITAMTNLSTVTLSYWYQPTATSSDLNLGFFGTSGFVASAGDVPSVPVWTYVTATGQATTTNSQIFIFPSASGEFYIDDVKLVTGTVPEAGVNLVTNGNFESGVLTPWVATTDFVTNTAVSSTVAFEGSRSLRLVAIAAGRPATSDSVYQNIKLDTNQTYTLSYWYHSKSPQTVLTNQLSGNLLVSRPDQDTAGLFRRLEYSSGTGIDDLRAWFTMHAVNSRRQLLEILSQFVENHFVTQHTKSSDYLSIYGDGNLRNRIATEWEWHELTRWRNALLNPDCTFYDLLKISAESPAMIVYLDSVNSRGDGTRVANENYTRELLELFTFGVDNGYDQNDIVAMSRAWTGWSVELVDAENAGNPFAPISRTYTPNVASQNKTNLVGVWAFNYKPGNHGTNRAPIFSVWATNTTNLVATGAKVVPDRFGPPWAGRFYQLNLPLRATGTTNSIQDGYDVISHLANQPFTQEYLSVKLCRLFVHDDFPNPTTRTNLPEYEFYNYTRPDLSAEAALVRDCMLAWENSVPKGRIRDVLSVIFNSELFRSHGGTMHKVKTPFEFTVSAVRALRSANPDGTFTASTDGYSLKTPMERMGGMSLFNRGDPDGYPESSAGWISAGTLVERLRFVQSLCIPAGQVGHTGSQTSTSSTNDAANCFADPVALLKKKLPSGQWNDAGAVADYLLAILYPGEGAGNLGPLRQAAINFLNNGSADSAPNTTPFASLAHTSANYDNRVRGLSAMLMTQPRFQEQ